jgi:hypothetical protein
MWRPTLAPSFPPWRATRKRPDCRAGVTIDPAVLAFDRRQHGTFRSAFENK